MLRTIENFLQKVVWEYIDWVSPYPCIDCIIVTTCSDRNCHKIDKKLLRYRYDKYNYKKCPFCGGEMINEGRREAFHGTSPPTIMNMSDCNGCCNYSYGSSGPGW